MNEEIVRALLRVKHAIKDNVLTNADLVDTFLKDMFPGDKYVGDRMLLLTLMREGLPLKAREGRFDDETALNAEARHIAQTYHMDEDWVRKALLVWRYVAQADESTTASGHVDADFLQLLSGFVPELKKVETSPVSNRVDEGLFQPVSDPSHNLKKVEASPVSAPQTSGGRKGRRLILWVVLLLVGLTAWHFAWYSVTGESLSSFLAKKIAAWRGNALEGTQSVVQEDAFLELCETGTVDEVRNALAFGANVHARDKYGRTTLMRAAGSNSNPEVVKELLAGGANVNARDKEGLTALMWAAGFNTTDMVKMLLAGGADINARDKNGETALIEAAALRFNPEVVKELLGGGANVNARGKEGVTALMQAAWYNPNPEVVKVLLENGADVSAVDKNGSNAIWWAQQREKENKEKILQILEEYASSVR